MSLPDHGPFDRELLSATPPEAFLAHRPQLVRYLSRKLGCPASAEDMAQETLVRALRACTESAVRSPRAFLFRIAANLVINHLIAAKRRQVTLDRARDYLFGDLGHPSAEQEVADSQQLAMVETTVAGLPDRTRHILYLNRCEGMSQSQIAKLLISSSKVNGCAG